jgi:aldose sugar dehydrogenase
MTLGKYKNPIIILSLTAIFWVSYTQKSSSASQTTQGKELYMLHCASCHKDDGVGEKGVFPPLLNSPWVNANDSLINTVLYGLNDPIVINGINYQGEMQAFDWLEDTELSQILNYVKAEFASKKDTISSNDIAKRRK